MPHPRFAPAALLLMSCTVMLAMADGFIVAFAGVREVGLNKAASDPPKTERSRSPSPNKPRQGPAAPSVAPVVPKTDESRGNRRRQTQAISRPAMQAVGTAIQQGFKDWDGFLPKWYAAHPDAWVAADVANSAWAETPWSRVNAFFGANWPENYYDYGNTLTLEKDMVCLFGYPWTNSAHYAQAARELAIGGLKPPDEKQPWLPLGVFTLTNNVEARAQVVVQLAVNKAGLVRGNHYRAADKKTLLIQGSIYRDTQRIAWIVGGNQEIVFDTGLYNLTCRETPVLLHTGPDETEQLLLVRMKRP